MLSDDFMLGMIAGEGSFHIVLEAPSRQRPKFTMNMHEREILEIMQEQLEWGTISKPDDTRTEWQVQGKEDLREMKEWVENNMSEGFKSTDKYRQFLLWSEAVEIRPDGREPIPVEDRKRLVELAFEIPKSDNRNKSKEEWLELVESAKVYYCDGTTNGGTECKNSVEADGATCRWH